MVGGAALSLAWLWSLRAPWPPPVTLASLVLITMMSEGLAVRLPKGGSTSVAFASDFAAVVLAGGIPAALVSISGAVTWQEIRERKSPWIVMFNVSQAIVCVAAATAILRIFDVEPIIASWPEVVLSPRVAVSWGLSALAFEVTNLLAVMAGISLAYGMPIRQVVRVQRLPAVLLNVTVLAPLGILIALVALRGRWLTGVVLAVPFMLERQVLHTYIGLYDSYTETLRLLVSALERKDAYTKGHSERVAALARGLASQLGLNSGQVELTERAALLHDVGKITVSSGVLLSENALSPSEMAQIREHPSVGARLVAEVEFLRDTAPFIQSHHERVDGSGYPQGLRGEEIPYISRVLACVDAYDAMTSDRSYRKALGHATALEEIRRAAGTHFDEQVVSSFLAYVSSLRPGDTDG